MKFKVGDKVKVREDLEGNTSYNGLYFNPKMEVYKGKTIIIERINCTERGLYVASDWYWNDEMLEPVKEEKKMRNIDVIAKDETLYIDSVCRACYIFKNSKSCLGVKCSECEFSMPKHCIDFLNYEYKEPKIKLTKFEYDLLKTYDEKGLQHYFKYLDTLTRMKEKGHFKNVDISMTVKDIIDNCEIEEE